MAKLITTKAEKKAASFLDWDDASLGRYCKQMALTIREAKTKLPRNKTDGMDDVMHAADGMLLISGMVEMNAGTMTLKFSNYTRKGKPEGDWEIRIRQISKGK